MPTWCEITVQVWVCDVVFVQFEPLFYKGLTQDGCQLDLVGEEDSLQLLCACVPLGQLDLRPCFLEPCRELLHDDVVLKFKV